MIQPAIVLNTVNKRFGRHEVLRDVSLEVMPGQTFAFLGRNGAGKTTTIRMLLALLEPDDGLVRVLGLNPAKHEIEVRRRVGYLAEDQMLSWRVTILPYVEQKALYDQFHLDEPWDSEHNRKLIEKMPAVYASPNSDAKLTQAGKTNYLAPTGKDTMFDGEKQANFGSITDGTSNTLLVVEANTDRAAIWTKPDDLEIDPEKPLDGLGDVRPGGFLAVFADGRTSFIQKTIDPQTLLNLFNPRDGQAVRVD